MNYRLLTLFITACLYASNVTSHGLNNGVKRDFLGSTILQNLPGYSLTSVTVELAPGISIPPHQHEGFVFVYVLDGTVLSQLNQEEPVVYRAGESWTESPGDRHSVTKNLSDTDKAKILAVFIAPNDAKLTLPVDVE